MDARQIKLVVSDVDGVWTDGRIIYVGDSREIKEFNVRDGLAVKLAQRAGLHVGVITSRKSRAVERRCRELGIVEVAQGAEDKLEALGRIAASLKADLAEICYVGDDLPDLAPIRACGISAAPSDAVAEVLDAVDWKLAARGGTGAFRELVERLLRERGQWDEVVAGFHGAKLTIPRV